MVSEQTRQTADDIKNYIKQHGIEYQSLYDLLDVAKVAFEKENDTEWALKVTSYIKECCTWAIQNSIEVTTDGRFVLENHESGSTVLLRIVHVLHGEEQTAGRKIL